MTDLLLIVHLAGERVAVPAALVESVVELEAVTPVPRAAAHVAGLAALRSRVLTVIDCAVSIGSAPEKEAREAIVVVADGHAYALVVEGVEDVVEASGPPAPITSALSRGWSRVGRGMVEVEGDLLLLVDPGALIAGCPAAAA